MDERFDKEVQNIICEWKNRDNLAEIYARYDNWLRVEVDGDDWEQMDFLQSIVDYLKSLIAITYMRQCDYYRDDNDTFNRWRKCN